MGHISQQVMFWRNIDDVYFNRCNLFVATYTRIFILCYNIFILTARTVLSKVLDG